VSPSCPHDTTFAGFEIDFLICKEAVPPFIKGGTASFCAFLRLLAKFCRAGAIRNRPISHKKSKNPHKPADKPTQKVYLLRGTLFFGGPEWGEPG
jgi:hypothetical protein